METVDAKTDQLTFTEFAKNIQIAMPVKTVYTVFTLSIRTPQLLTILVQIFDKYNLPDVVSTLKIAG